MKRKMHSSQKQELSERIPVQEKESFSELFQSDDLMTMLLLEDILILLFSAISCLRKSHRNNS